MRRILYITAFPPCQKTAGQDYSRRLLCELIDLGHKVSLIYAEYPGHSPEIPEKVAVLRKITPSLKNCLLKLEFHPFFTKRFDSETLSFIQSIASDYDMLYFDFSQVHLYSLYVNHPNKILMCHDIIAQKFSRRGCLQLPWIKRSEGKLLRSANQIITFSEKDCGFLQKTYGLNAIHVNFYLKNGLFAYSSEIEVLENRFCFYGAWNRAENTECLEWFLKKVCPKLKVKFDFVVIGGGMPKLLQTKLELYKNFSYLGFVDNPVKEIAKCQALIAPLHKGAGVKVKVIDALSSGTSVIGTNVAFEGIEDNEKNRLFFRAETPDAFVAILNNWRVIDVQSKQAATNEFFARYNTNHFTDLL